MTSRPALMRRGVIAVACLALCLVTTPLIGQTVGGTFVGRVKDQSGATLPYTDIVDQQRRDQHSDLGLMVRMPTGCPAFTNL